MDVTIIGTGSMARGISSRALAGGHAVTLPEHEPGEAEALAAELPGDARTGTLGDPLDGDVVVLAVPYDALDDVLGRYEGQWDGRVVVDITNPIDLSSFTPISVPAGSGAQQVAERGRRARRSSRRSTPRSPGRSSRGRPPVSCWTS
jgi:8-hydroxy-5-deazaflavin:NADPH oxidoreductase